VSAMTTPRDIDGRISQGWGGAAPNGVHVNVILARRGSPTAAAMTNAFTGPTPGFTPIVVCTGIDQPSYRTVYPPTILLNKAAPAGEFAEALIYGAAQVGIAQGVLDSVADDLLHADQETVVFVSLWIDADADAETAVRQSARQATRAAIGEAVDGQDPAAARQLVESREDLRHPFYHGD
jgi:formaldehyde-activating enzyme